MNRWELKDSIRERNFDTIQNFLKEGGELDLTDTELNPSTLECMLEGFGFEVTDGDSNGWEMDFDIEMHNHEDDELISTVTIRGCGMTFELFLTSLIE